MYPPQARPCCPWTSGSREMASDARARSRRFEVFIYRQVLARRGIHRPRRGGGFFGPRLGRRRPCPHRRGRRAARRRPQGCGPGASRAFAADHYRTTRSSKSWSSSAPYRKTRTPPLGSVEWAGESLSRLQGLSAASRRPQPFPGRLIFFAVFVFSTSRQLPSGVGDANFFNLWAL